MIRSPNSWTSRSTSRKAAWRTPSRWRRKPAARKSWHPSRQTGRARAEGRHLHDSSEFLICLRTAIQPENPPLAKNKSEQDENRDHDCPRPADILDDRMPLHDAFDAFILSPIRTPMQHENL